MKLTDKLNLQLYPQKSNIKIVGIPITILANGIDYQINPGYRYFFDNDAELNNSIITGIVALGNTNPMDQYPNALANGTLTASSLTLSLRGKNDKILVDQIPLHNLLDQQDTTGINPLQLFTRTIKRFFIKTKWDKCFISVNSTFVSGTDSLKNYIYLAVYYKPNGTKNL